MVKIILHSSPATCHKHGAQNYEPSEHGITRHRRTCAISQVVGRTSVWDKVSQAGCASQRRLQ
jgi:hypothetical protein